MTVRELWTLTLTDLSKVNAPSLLLEDFIYFMNKAVNQYINKRYNIYDVNQQTTDDLRVLKTSAVLDVTKCSNNGSSIYGALGDWGAGDSKLFGGTYEVELPPDYMHMLNCIVIYQMQANYKCYKKDNYVLFAAKRLTADAWSIIVNDYYNRPLPLRPYYYLHNVNSAVDKDGKVFEYTRKTISTNPYVSSDANSGELEDGTDMNEEKYSVGVEIGQDGEARYTGITNFRRKIVLNNGDTVDNIDKELGFRYGNASKVRCEIRFGLDDSVFKPVSVMADYIKTPLYYKLTQEQVNLTLDTSMVLEFPDYVCYEIQNELNSLIMENTADPRLQTNKIITTSIGSPAQQLATPVAQA